MSKSKKLKMKKVFFGATSKAAGRKKSSKVKRFFNNPYVEAVAGGLLGGAAYVVGRTVAEKIFDRKVEVDVTEKVDCEAEEKTTVSCGKAKKSVQLFAYNFHNYAEGQNLYVCPRFREPLDDEDLTRFKELAAAGNEDDLIEALKEHPQLYSIYVG